MNDDSLIHSYNSQTALYHQAFQVFLDHTDQKTQMRNWLERLVERLPQRRIFLDAGAGNGQSTAWFMPAFQRTIAIEPNPSLREDLRRVSKAMEVLPKKILEARPSAPADLILCSHVFYYLDRHEWLETMNKLLSWLSPEGVAVVVLQNHATDCMRMLDHFLGRHFNLGDLADELRQTRGSAFDVRLETVSAQIVTEDFESAFCIAEFMLNLLPLPKPPARGCVEAYVREKFADPTGGYRFSCNQDFLHVRSKTLP